MQAQFDLTTLNGANGFTIPGIAPYDELGASVSTAGDLNGDGIHDVILGAPGVDKSTGTVYVIFGNRSEFPASFSLSNLNGRNGFMVLGIAVGYSLGQSISTSGDINGDGINDLLVVARVDKTSYVIFGMNGSFPPVINLLSFKFDGRNGFIVNGTNYFDVPTAGDINGDSIDDLILGASRSNSVYVIFGTRNGFPASFNLNTLNGSNGFSVSGITFNDQLGKSISMGGDLNGDQIDDLIIGTSGASAFYVIFGTRETFSNPFNLSTLNGTNGFIIVSGGLSINAGGDVNGDGVNDLVLGSKYGAARGGLVYVIFGDSREFPAFFNLTNLNGTNGFSITGTTPGDLLGYSVNIGGDINGDGNSDLAVGAPGKISAQGGIYVIFGRDDEFPASLNLILLNGSNGFSINGVGSVGQLGTSIDLAGDINGDGIEDLLVTACYANLNTGAGYVIFGGIVFIKNELSIVEGQTVLLTSNNLNAAFFGSNFINFTVSNVQGGRFEFVNNSGIAIFNFTQQEINTGEIQFVSDRSANVSYRVTASNSQTSVGPKPSAVTFTNHAPIILNAPLSQVFEINKPFQFNFLANQTFNDPDGDPLNYSAKSSDGSPLPNWLHFDNTRSNQFNFTGTIPALGSNGIRLVATDPLNLSTYTDFELIGVVNNNNTSSNENQNTVNQIITPIATAMGVGLLAGGIFGLWRYLTNKKGREGYQLANYLRNSLNLKEVDNFYENENGRKYVSIVQEMENKLKAQGVDIDNMNDNDLQKLADDISDAARNKITSATDCLGHSVITVSDLKNRSGDIINEVQVLRSGMSGQQYEV